MKSPCLRENSYRSQPFYLFLYWEETFKLARVEKWISVFGKGFLGVAEIANFENLATQDTL